jgi:hypothetical protein
MLMTMSFVKNDETKMLLYGVGFYKREGATNEINGAWICGFG